MRLTIAKFLALGIAIGYVILIVTRDGGDAAQGVQYIVCLLVVLGLIWFPEQVADFTGYVGRGGNIDVQTPPLLVPLAGWFFLVGLPLVVWWLSR